MAIVCVSSKRNLTLKAVKKKFVLDSEADFADLPKCCTGSLAVVADGSIGYMVNASGKWVENKKAATDYLIAEEASF